MADDYSQRPPYRTQEAPPRVAPAREPAPAVSSDPLAELARLIGQSDPFGEYGRDASPQQQAHSQRAEPADWSRQAPSAHYAPQPPQGYAAPEYDHQDYADAPTGAGGQPYANEGQVPAYLLQQSRDSGYAENYPDRAPYGAEEQDFYDDVPPSRRRMGIVVIAGVVGLALLGTAGAFGYRAMFGSSGTPGQPPIIKADTVPSKIVPASTKDASSNKQITDRVNDRAQGEAIVSREEQPVDMKDKPTGIVYPPGGTGILSTEPKKVRTVAIRPDQITVADAGSDVAPPMQPAEPSPARSSAPTQPAPTASEREPAPRPAAARAAPPAQRAAAAPAAPAPGNAPLSLNPNVPTRTAAVAPARAAPAATAPATGGYTVQLTAQRSEAEAQAAFHSLQAKFPNQLGGRTPLIHKADLGDKGVYYRAMVGPFADANAANKLCSGLKAAGGQCIVQRN